MSDRSEPEFEVVVKPGFLVTMACLVVVYGIFHGLNTVRSGAELSVLESVNWGAAVTLLILFGTLLHELGHVIAGVLAGHHWTKAVLNGAGLGVVIEPRPHGWDRVLRSAAGPLAHLLFALPLLAVALMASPAGRPTILEAQTSVWWVAGVSSLFLALLNALPVPGFDGAKVLDGVRELRGTRLESAAQQDGGPLRESAPRRASERPA
nr:M50 family metallopeptidase [Propionicimonas sp.]